MKKQELIYAVLHVKNLRFYQIQRKVQRNQGVFSL